MIITIAILAIVSLYVGVWLVTNILLGYKSKLPTSDWSLNFSYEWNIKHTPSVRICLAVRIERNRALAEINRRKAAGTWDPSIESFLRNNGSL